MKGRWRIAGWVAVMVVVAGVWLTIHRVRAWRGQRLMFLVGAAIQRDSDPRKELPLAGVQINATNGKAATECRSDSSGLFQLAVPAGSARGEAVTIVFRHPGYHPLVLNATVGNEICLARMEALPHQVSAGREVAVSHVLVRYSTDTTTIVNVGSAAKTFQVENRGDVPCNGHKPCSPDGRWKAAVGSLSLDVGSGNEFSNVRVSCIAGPCPFTRIQPVHYREDGRALSVQAVDWSDTAVFLLQAEVIRSEVSDVIRETYPVIFGDALNFTVPSGAEGVSVEAEMDGEPIVFPLGPATILSWADCSANVSGDQSRVYRCALNPGYRFQ